MSCPACGAAVPDAARFCPECGRRLDMRPDERRFVTVLMGDLVGFTTLSETTDPEHVKNLVDACFERLVAEIDEHGGRLDKIVGDQIVAQFGAPVTHEDDAERAVRTALRMREALDAFAAETGRPVQMRIGVNTGEVLVGALRAGGEATVMGDVVNIASRLEGTAAPGQVVVGPATYAATRTAIRYEPLGSLSVRGRDEPVEAWAAIEALAPPGRRRKAWRAPLVGRDHELAALRALLELTVERSRAQLVVLRGDAGIGKARLADELGAIAAEVHGATVLVGQAVPYGDTNPFGPVADALRHACALDADSGGDPSRLKLVGAVTRLLDLAPEAPETERLVEGLLHAIEGVTRPAVDPGRARDDAMRSVHALLGAMAKSAPLVLVLADLQWVDAVVPELVDRLLTKLRSLPVLIVATTRPGADTEWSAPSNVLSLHLEALDATATGELVDALFGEPVEPDIHEFLRERSGGNPFFVEELVALMRESAVEPGVRPHLDHERFGKLPATLHGLVAARLDALDRSERSLLEDFAVVGGNGRVADVLTLSGATNAATLLNRLVERDLLVVDGDEFRFKSELIRDVAYNILTKAERARRHAEMVPILRSHGPAAHDHAAEHLRIAAELVGEIGSVAGVPPDVRDQAVEALRASAAHAESVESWLAVGRLHDQVLELLPADALEERWPSLLGRAKSRAEQRELDLARDDATIVLEEARELGDERCVAQALLVLGDIAAHAADYSEAERMYGEAAQRWRALGDASKVADALRGLGIANLFRGDLDESERLISDALASFKSVGDQRGEAWALQNLAWIAFTRGDATEAERRLERSAELFEQIGDWGGLGWAFGLFAFVRFIQGRLDDAAALAEQVAEEGGETGNRWAVGMMDVLLASVNLWRGRVEEAVRRGREAGELFAAIGDRWGELQANAPVSRALTFLGRRDEFADALAHLTALAEAQPDHELRRAPRTLEVQTAVLWGDPEHALTLLDADGMLRGRRLWGDADRVAALSVAYLQLGRVDEAIEVVLPDFDVLTDAGPRLSLGGVLGLALASSGKTRDALALVEQLDAIEGGTYADRILHRFAEGAALLQEGLRDRALEAFDAAVEVAEGTDSVAHRALALLARAVALESVGDPAAPDALVHAHAACDDAAIAPAAWELLFRGAVGARAAVDQS